MKALKTVGWIAASLIFLNGLWNIRFKPAAETMTVETFMEYHSAEEIMEYFGERFEIDVAANALQTESDGEYFCFYRDEADDLVNLAYAYGYYRGATRETEKDDPWWDEWSELAYNIVTDAINNGDFATVYDYVGSYSVEDFME